MQARLEELVAGVDRKMTAGDSVEAKLSDFDRRMGAKLEAQDQAKRQAQDQALAPDKSHGQTKEDEPKHQHSRGFGIGM